MFERLKASNGPNMEPKGSQNGAKIGANSDSEFKWPPGTASGRSKDPFGELFSMILVIFLSHLGAQNCFQEPSQNSEKSNCKSDRLDANDFEF